MKRKEKEKCPKDQKHQERVRVVRGQVDHEEESELLDKQNP